MKNFSYIKLKKMSCATITYFWLLNCYKTKETLFERIFNTHIVKSIILIIFQTKHKTLVNILKNSEIIKNYTIFFKYFML